MDSLPKAWFVMKLINSNSGEWVFPDDVYEKDERYFLKQ